MVNTLMVYVIHDMILISWHVVCNNAWHDEWSMHVIHRLLVVSLKVGFLMSYLMLQGFLMMSNSCYGECSMNEMHDLMLERRDMTNDEDDLCNNLKISKVPLWWVMEGRILLKGKMLFDRGENMIPWHLSRTRWLLMYDKVFLSSPKAWRGLSAP